MSYPRPRLLDEIARSGARHVVIEASAGTGKTFTLEHAVVERLLDGVPLGRLLAVTFTERAAGELRERVRELLQKVLSHRAPDTPAGTSADTSAETLGASQPACAWTLDGAARRRLRQALLDFDDAAILTIHGFCQRVLTEHAFLMDRLLEQELVDSREAFARGFRHVLRGDLATRQRGELRAWLDHGDVEQLEELLHDVDAARADALRPELQEAPLREALAALAASCQRGLRPAMRALQQSGLHHATKKAAANHLQRVAEAAAAWADRGDGALLALSVDESLDGPLKYLGSKGAALLEAAPEAAGLLEHALAVHRWRVPIAAAAAQLFLPQVRARVAADKRRRGEYDFDDMLRLVRDAVETSPVADALVASLRRQYVHALIDEFQDTDDAQWSTFRRVFVEAPAPHALWVIGDPKQAIYAFRGADVFTYLRATRELLGPEAAPFRLVRNFRSTAPMVEAFNALFEAPATEPEPPAEPPTAPGPARPFFEGEITYPPAECGQPDRRARDAAGRDLTPVHLFHFVRDDEAVFRAAALRELHARRIAEEARRLVEGRTQVSGGGRGPRDLEYRDLFVLTRTTKEGLLVAQHLRAQGVPFAFYKQEGLLQTLEADDVHAVLCAVLDPRDRSRRLRAWATPFFGLALDELEACRDLPGDHPLVARLLAWSRLAERRAYGALFAALVEDSGLARRELLLRVSERELTNYLHLLELLHEAAARGRLELHELVRLLGAWMRQERAPEGQDPGVQRLESDAAAVQVMTMHKAKGLEAEVVFLFGGLSDLRSRDLHLYHDSGGGMVRGERPEDERGVVVYHDPRTLRRVVHVGPLTDEIRQRVVAEQEAEERRLIYVAVTRARARLYLPSFGRHQGQRWGRPEERWDYPHLGGCVEPLVARLFELMQGDPARLDPRLFEVEVLRPAQAGAQADALDGASDGDAPAPDVAAALAAWSPPEALLRPLDDDLRREAEARAALRRDPRHAPLVITSYSAMKRAADAYALSRATAAPALEPTPSPSPPAPAPAPSPAPAPTPAPAPAPAPAPDTGDDLPGGADMGNCVHDLLEQVALDDVVASADAEAWCARPEVQRLARRAAVKSGVPTRHAGAVLRLAHRALTTPLRLAGGALLPGVAGLGAQALREFEFTYPIPEADHAPLLPSPGARAGPGLTIERGWVRGYMDLVLRHEGKGYVADWKTNRLSDYGPARMRELVERDYDLQRKVYALALAKLLGVTTPEAHAERFGGVLFLFLRGLGPPPADLAPGVEADAPGVVFDRPSFDDLRRYERELVEFPAYSHGWDPAWTQEA